MGCTSNINHKSGNFVTFITQDRFNCEIDLVIKGAWKKNKNPLRICTDN